MRLNGGYVAAIAFLLPARPSAGYYLCPPRFGGERCVPRLRSSVGIRIAGVASRTGVVNLKAIKDARPGVRSETEDDPATDPFNSSEGEVPEGRGRNRFLTEKLTRGVESPAGALNRIVRSLNDIVGSVFSSEDAVEGTENYHFQDEELEEAEVLLRDDAGHDHPLSEGDEDDDWNEVDEGQVEKELLSMMSGTRDYQDEPDLPFWKRLGPGGRSKGPGVLKFRASTETTSAIQAPGPFSELETYMTLPVSAYNPLDNSVIRRTGDSSFCFQLPLRDLVGLELTPTLEVDVEPNIDEKVVVIRSTHSTLYGTVSDRPADDASSPTPNTPGTPFTSPVKEEFVRVGFIARLRWAEGNVVEELSKKKVGRRQALEAKAASRLGVGLKAVGIQAMGVSKAGEATGAGPWLLSGQGGLVGRDSKPPQAGIMGEEGEFEEDSGTVACEVEVEVDGFLPPSVSAYLPRAMRRLVVLVLRSVLTTVVNYILPRFLSLLVEDYTKWKDESLNPKLGNNTSINPHVQAHVDNTEQEAGGQDTEVINAETTVGVIGRVRREVARRAPWHSEHGEEESGTVTAATAGEAKEDQDNENESEQGGSHGYGGKSVALEMGRKKGRLNSWRRVQSWQRERFEGKGVRRWRSGDMKSRRINQWVGARAVVWGRGGVRRWQRAVGRGRDERFVSDDSRGVRGEAVISNSMIKGEGGEDVETGEGADGRSTVEVEEGVVEEDGDGGNDSVPLTEPRRRWRKPEGIPINWWG